MIVRTLALRGLGWCWMGWVILASSGCSSAAPGGSASSSSSSPSSATSGSIAGRVHALNKSLAVNKPSSGTTAQGFQASGSSAYTYVASVDSPTNAATGHVLQATNFAFDATYAYVTYNMDGPSTEGALDIIDLTDDANPKLVGSLVFPAEEFADIALSGTTAYLVGASADDGGLLAVVDVSDRTAPKEVADLDLGSYYGTSIALDGTTAYITTGDVGGGIASVDVSQPAAPSLLGVVALPNALSTIRRGGVTLALGGKSEADLYAVSGSAAQALVSIGSGHFDAPVRMAAAAGKVVTNGAHSGLSVLDVADDGSSASVAFHADLGGTGNGIDIAGSLAILAQGEIGTLLYDFSNPAAPALLGSFAFPDERGSSNEVRFGAAAGSEYVFLSDGLNGFRIVRIGSASDGADAGATCTTEWWLATVPGDWWQAPATSDASSPGAWTALPGESTSLCLVEQFVPTQENAQCSAIQVKRAIAIGPQPNEGQVCPVICPAGTVIQNVHSRYGEASPLNQQGDFSCTGTTDPDQNEISCDVMSDFCDGQTASCQVTYNNSFCGDPWYDCIKSGRTKWQCVPVAN